MAKEGSQEEQHLGWEVGEGSGEVLVYRCYKDGINI